MSCLNGIEVRSDNAEDLKYNFCHYKSRGLSQRIEACYAFYDIIKSYKPELIIEIGTFQGGLTNFLRDCLNENGLNNSIVLTYDINEVNKLSELSNNNINFKMIDYFQDINYINDMISNKGLCIILCDGGNKKNEFLNLAPLIKKNDIIMAHDFINEGFEGIWPASEFLYDEDIKICCNKNNLEEFHQNYFDGAAWFSRVKYE